VSVVGALLLLAVNRDLGASMSSTMRRGESIASTLATNSRLSAASPARLSARVSTSVSKDCKREVNAAPRSQIFREPMSRKVGSWESRAASLTSSYPANRLYIDLHLRTAPIASKPTSISAFVAFYQIDSSLRKWKSGFHTEPAALARSRTSEHWANAKPDALTNETSCSRSVLLRSVLYDSLPFVSMNSETAGRGLIEEQS
jgi:hypothetical protein